MKSITDKLKAVAIELAKACEQIEKMPIFSTIIDFRDVSTEALSRAKDIIGGGE